MRIILSAGLLVASIHLTVSAQGLPTSAAQFEVVSIKRSAPGANGGAMRTLPDGGFTMSNQPISGIIMLASPESVREAQGLPTWARTEGYDIIAKAPAGGTDKQFRDMMRNMLIDRLKVAGHVEQQERDTFALVLARKDGRLGPGLTSPSPECATPPTPDQPRPPEQQRQCGGRMGPGSIELGATTMARLAQSLSGLAGGVVNDRTGLTGLYAVSLHFASRRGGAPATAAPDDAPEFFTALQEQLGLKLQGEKTMVPVFVIDHIERPSEN